MLKQIINGKTVATLYIEGSQADMDALKGLLEGRVDEYKLKASGGTAAPLPNKLNSKRFSVGKFDGRYPISCAFRLHHLPTQKNEEDVKGAVLGKFDAHYGVSSPCEYVNMLKGGDN